MKRGGPLRRKTRLRTKGGSRFPGRRAPDYMAHLAHRLKHEWIPCDCGCGLRATDRAHLHKKGSGGYDLDGVALLNRLCHCIGPKSQEGRTDAFCHERGCDLWAKAREHTQEWRAQHEARTT